MTATVATIFAVGVGQIFGIIFAILLVVLVIVAVWDTVQKKHAILRNYPIIGHLRYLLERIGPELRQYIVTNNDEERPFSRDQRSWVYSTAKAENPYTGFGTDNDLSKASYVFIRQSAFPLGADDANAPSKGNTEAQPLDIEPGASIEELPADVVLGEWRNRPGAFRPQSLVNISAMSFGSLSGTAIEALNRGAKQAGCLHNTGEGGISDYHRSGGDLVFQLGTGYFGARDKEGSFSMDRLLESIDGAPVKAIEIKLSQGAKPGLGGVLPAAKVTSEIAEARGVPVGVTVASPPTHEAFDSVPTMVDFVERVADATGLPVGIKSAVGEHGFWVTLADHMADTQRGPDFITIDGSEGGTGAAPLAFADHVALPFRAAFAEVYQTFDSRGMSEPVAWIGAGRLGFPVDALVAMALGVDVINVGREAMLAVGCIQAQKCHTGHCPTGVATQNKRLARGLDPGDKSQRTGRYIQALRHDLLALAHACGEAHPGHVSGDSIELAGIGPGLVSLWDHYGYQTGQQQRPES